ncbi:MAG: SCP2 sterol-binding domain-containing protein [Zoogloeaceae bacterium]|jgi:predicted lipid carrier protein YhbT|nr:SCP2 sterol-binding domain-containing protein [Zoogloeaceae bacterium]
MNPILNSLSALSARLRAAEFRLPGFVRVIQRRLPQWPHAVSVALALNAARRLEILPEEALALVRGKVVRVVVEDGGAEAWFTAKGGVFLPFSASGAIREDVCFRGELHAFLKLLVRQEDPDTLFFNRQLAIEGDTELGLAIKNLLDGIDWPPPFLLDGLARLKSACAAKIPAAPEPAPTESAA